MVNLLAEITQPLIDAYERNRDTDWEWFEEKMTYDNAILPLALLHSAEITGNEKAKKIAMTTMEIFG